MKCLIYLYYLHTIFVFFIAMTLYQIIHVGLLDHVMWTFYYTFVT